MQKDRRQVPRAQTLLRIELYEFGEWLVAHDISLGGLSVTSKKVYWPGTLLRLRFVLPEQKRAIRVSCRVVELTDVPHGVGLTLRFLKLSAEAQLALHAYIDGRSISERSPRSSAEHALQFVRRMIEDCAQLKALARITPL